MIFSCNAFCVLYTPFTRSSKHRANIEHTSNRHQANLEQTSSQLVEPASSCKRDIKETVRSPIGCEGHLTCQHGKLKLHTSHALVPKLLRLKSGRLQSVVSNVGEGLQLWLRLWLDYDYWYYCTTAITIAAITFVLGETQEAGATRGWNRHQ